MHYYESNRYVGKGQVQFMSATILVADDEVNITDVCRRYLEREGYAVWTADDGNQALMLWQQHRPDLIVLDLMMPGRTGWQVCEEIRSVDEVPILMLTARGDEPDRLLGLTMGADDYLTKPFSPRELVLRVKNILRRSQAVTTQLKAAAPADRTLSFTGISIHPDERRVCLNGRDIELTAKEFDLLFLLANHPNQVFSRNQLLQKIWDTDFDGDTTTVTVHIRRLREKIENQPSDPKLVKTVWGIGYKFEERSER
jgi:two-component system, OmpR family, response regulator VicR